MRSKSYGEVASWHTKAAKVFCLTACCTAVVLGAALSAPPAWSKTKIGTAGAATFALNDYATARKIVELVSYIRFARQACNKKGYAERLEKLKEYLYDAELKLGNRKTFVHGTPDEADPQESLLGAIATVLTGVDVNQTSIPKSRQQIKDDREDMAGIKSFRTYYFSSREAAFPQPCPPLSDQLMPFRPDRGPRVWMAVQGGGLFTSGSGRNITGTDVFTPATPEVDEHSFAGGDSGGVIGGTATVVLPVQTPPIFNGMPADIFVRTGFFTNLSGSQSESVSGINTTPQGTGTVEDKLKWFVPLLAGVTVPVGPKTYISISGGIRFAARFARMDLTEAGAGPGGMPISASKTWTSVDPTIGAGISFDAGSINGMPIRIGIDGTISFVDSKSLDADSPNYTTQSYRFETGRKVETSVMFGVSVGLP